MKVYTNWNGVLEHNFYHSYFYHNLHHNACYSIMNDLCTFAEISWLDFEREKMLGERKQKKKIKRKKRKEENNFEKR